MITPDIEESISHLETIRQNLWYGNQYRRKFGKAALMIGAGFSRNAKKALTNTPEFPLSYDICKKLLEKLRPIEYHKILQYDNGETFFSKYEISELSKEFVDPTFRRDLITNNIFHNAAPRT
ncbi:hypothetical protein [uncultured Methanospirillum sp.]|uniref:hypothetical protein n=1 Tax=uncultured Methanospirillum sp. TaxID=262503 RepID=UPI0029C8B1F0|nr:hypothetical protein [uncultured Methanospirillum sp.]